MWDWTQTNDNTNQVMVPAKKQRRRVNTHVLLDATIVLESMRRANAGVNPKHVLNVVRWDTWLGTALKNSKHLLNLSYWHHLDLSY